MFLFTDFVPPTNVEVVFQIGNSFVLVVAEILFVNVGLLVKDMVNEQRAAARKKRVQQQYE